MFDHGSQCAGLLASTVDASSVVFGVNRMRACQKEGKGKQKAACLDIQEV